MDNVLVIDDAVTYPEGNVGFSPSEFYLEYPFELSSIARASNNVYAMVRECLHQLKLDNDNYGTKEWNPIGQLVRKGDTVLLKPNWVSHKNKNRAVNDNLKCLVTHPSVVRTIVDYVLIARNHIEGDLRIIIGDAPMQGTDLEELFDIAGYRHLFSFLDANQVKYEVSDFRKHLVDLHNGVLSQIHENANSYGSVSIDLGEHSLHAEFDRNNPQYKVSDYLSVETSKYHSNGKHVYEISKVALGANLIINIPKPKTHRLAGFTGAMKNMVGLVYEKASLPHRKIGATDTGKGDAYRVSSSFKRLMEYFDEKKTEQSLSGRKELARLYSFFERAFYLCGKSLSGDQVRTGSWYGNDTIWRTIIDINNIIKYADVNSIVDFDKKQRNTLIIADMIVSGEGEGPIGPSPKQTNAIMGGLSNEAFDIFLSRFMGFDGDNIPLIKHIQCLKDANNTIQIFIKKDDRFIKENKMEPDWRFIPHSCWE
ncbi:hypothetical protein FACS1894184_09880 [Clostridia bacterium]|nr:hypothetical protein FACS1894184_09880 [Clostridia bacterium]